MRPSRANGTIELVTPPEWQEALVPPPELPGSSEVAVDRWSAWGEPHGAGRLVVGCLGIDLSAWTDEATPIALERLSSTANRTATRLDGGHGVRVAGETRRGGVVEQTLATAAEDDAKIVGRTFLGFTAQDSQPRLTGCFAVCAPTTVACEQAVAAARIGPAFVTPPPSTALLRAVGAGIHHPRAVALSSTALFLAVGVIAVWTRPRASTKVKAP